MNWRRVNAAHWWAPDHGSVYRIDGEWWGMNSSDPMVRIEPVVGPFVTRLRAISAYDAAMRRSTSTTGA